MLKIIGKQEGAIVLVSPSFSTRAEAYEWAEGNAEKTTGLELRLEDELELMARSYYRHAEGRECLHCEAKAALNG